MKVMENDTIYYRRNMPHIQPGGATFFVTFRLAGSLPKEVVIKLKEEHVQNERILRKVKDENGVVKLERGLRRRLVSGINNLSSELEDFSKGYMQFPPFGFESVRVRIKKALKGEGELLVLAVDRPDDIANIDVAAKNVMFDSLGKEDKPAATLDERYLLMNFYRVRNLPNAPVSVYCLEAKDKKSGATVYALDFAPRDADPQEWWKNKKH